MDNEDSLREALALKKKRLPGQAVSWGSKRIKNAFYWDRGLEGVLLAMFLASTIAAVIGALATPTGLGRGMDMLMYLTANTGAFAGIAAGGAVLLSFLYIPLPRLVLSASAYTAYLAYYIQEEAGLGAYFTIIMTGVFMISAYMLGGLIQLWMGKIRLGMKLIYSLIPAAWFVFIFTYHPIIEHHEPVSSFADLEETDFADTGDPGEPGIYDVQKLHYGSGQDRHRDHFGEGTDIVSSAVDASAYFDDGEWEPWRTRFWGFDESAFPLNGEMWLPEGEGPFPVVLIAHGNHRMENFSDAGYGYLGEHLASHGYAAISLDQNFVNFSNWTGSPNEDMKLRAWLYMQHLLELQVMQETEGHLLENKLDINEIALVGHSRGGQAAAMAADYERFFEEDSTLDGMENLEIKTVVGLAPTDQEVDDTRPAPEDINYLTLHGARDGDVHNFRGDRQYSRVTFSGEESLLKSAVYVAEANHSQFNTDWGRADMRLPGGLFLSREQMLEPEEQQKLTKVYLTAFFEAVIRGEEDYVPLFQDVRHGSSWLPETKYVTRYLDSSYEPLVSFNRENDRTMFPEGIRAEGESFTEWDKVSTLDRAGSRKAPDGVQLEWGADGDYSLLLPDEFRDEYFEGNETAFSFSMAQMDREFDGEVRGDTSPAADIRFVFTDGTETLVSVDDLYNIPSSIWTQYSRYPFLEDHFREGKYEEAIEPAFQTYIFQTDNFTEGMELQNLERITWEFYDGPGNVVIDDIGFFRNE
ncbi:MAG: hypothetical protein EA344_08330 [Alkalicoccus sp.]|nr:MAG: hypothetical protein EA344_08330 [Alkalicoccus sp.]